MNSTNRMGETGNIGFGREEKEFSFGYVTGNYY